MGATPFLRAMVWTIATVVAIAAVPSRAADGQVVIREAEDEGRPVFVIETEVATYHLSKGGAALTSLVDRDGRDWISFRPEHSAGVPDGSFGWYRGLPNMTRQGFGHAAGEGASSATFDLLDTPLPKATVVSYEGLWGARWEFYPTFARMTITGAGDDYWLLYEGTPGGKLDLGDLCWVGGEEPASCDDSWRGDIDPVPGVADGFEWMVFGDPAIDRSLVLLHNDDDITDQHRLLAGMTVFGFGRSDPGRLQWALRDLGLPLPPTSGRLPRSQDTMIITFAESVAPGLVEAHLMRLSLHPGFRPDGDVLAAFRRGRVEESANVDDPT